MKLFSEIIVFVLFALEIGMLQGCESQTQKRFVRPIVSATELMSHYMRDARHADETYAGRGNFFIVTGTIKQHHKEESDSYINQFNHSIWLYVDDSKLYSGVNSNPFAEVLCKFHLIPAVDPLNNLKVGDFVKIRGYVKRQEPELFMADYMELPDAKFGGLRKGTYTNTSKNFFHVILEGCSLVGK